MFGESTVYTNLLPASQSHDGTGDWRGFFAQGSGRGGRCIDEVLKLVGRADLPYGYQRLVGVALALAGSQKLLRLAEPAAQLVPPRN